jgi:hypothetical protein
MNTYQQSGIILDCMIINLHAYLFDLIGGLQTDQSAPNEVKKNANTSVVLSTAYS